MRKISIELGQRSAGGLAQIAIGSGPVHVSREPKADIVFVIDTTGSMDDKINGLLESCQLFVDELVRRRIDWRVAIVSFGDLTVPGDTIQATRFSSNTDTVRGALRRIPHNRGGGNSGESSLEAVMKALGLSDYRPEVIKVFILITDEPALQSQQVTAKTVTEALRFGGALTFVISDPIDYYELMAKTTGGSWFQISGHTDFLSILDVLGKRVSQVVSDVQCLADGDVQKYLQLSAGQ